MLSFESLGENCEFGLIQHHFDVEPLRPVRWTATSPGSLIEALNDGFEGVGTAAYTRLIEIGTEYATTHRIYGMGSHTFVAVDREADMYRDQLQRLSYLRGKLIEDLEDRGKIFVYHLEASITPDEFRSIHRAIQRYGAIYFQCVQKSSDEHPSGSVTPLDHGAMIGYLSRLGPERRADGDSWDRLVYDEWLTICRKQS